MTERNWEKFYEVSKEYPPSQLLLEALEYVPEKSKALDLGAGALRDSKFLLSQGFEVVAVDSSELPVQIEDEKFKFVKSTFGDFEFPQGEYDLVNAQFSLPFAGPEEFDTLWKKIIGSLKDQGVFTGQLFGPKDDWAHNSSLVFHTREEVEELLSELESIRLEEIENDGKTSDGNPKHWHLFHIIARKK